MSQMKTATKPQGKKDPLISLTKRANVTMTRAIVTRVVAILVSLVVCAIVTLLLTGQNPFAVFATMVKANFGSAQLFRVSLRNLAFLLIISLAVTPAFRMRFWNIGAEGQALVGGLASALLLLNFGGKMADWLLLLVMFITSLLAGAIWGLIPAVFKAIWGTNETLFTLMMNYIAIQFVKFFLKMADKTGSNTVGPKLLHFSSADGEVFGANAKFWVILSFAVLLTVFLHFYLKNSKHGYEISVVGESENTARYIGINVKKVILRTMLISGAICGLLGFLLVGVSSRSIDPNIVGGRGFTAIMVSWLAKFNPIMMVLTSFLLVFLEIGAKNVAMMFRLSLSFSDILIGIILFFIIGCEFFLNYKLHFNFKREKKEDEN